MTLPEFEQLLQWSAEHPGWVLALGFAFAFVEALALVGIVVPGIFLLFVLGALVGWDAPLLSTLGIAVTAGAVAGDGASFWLGRRYRGRMRTSWPFSSRAHWLDTGEQFLIRHGGKSIFIARFVGPIRPVLPLVAGSMGMPPRVFVPRMLIACALWAPVMILPGALFGESLELAAEFGGRLTLLLTVLVVGGWLLIWGARVVYEAGARRAPWWLKNLALWLRRHRRLGRWFGPLVEPGRREVLSVVTLGLLLVASLATLFTALLLAPLSSAAWQSGFELSGIAASLRSHFADPLFFVVAIAFSPPAVLGLIGFVAVLLALQHRWNALLHWLLATLGGWLLALVLNAAMGVALGRPPAAGSVGQVPHIDFVLVVLVFGFAALIIARDFRPRQRKWMYLTTVGLLALAAFAEFYLARATINGLAAALALALGWLALTGIGYRLRAVPSAAPGRMLAGFVVVWATAAGVLIPQLYPEFARAHELAQPTRELDAGEWWHEQWRSLPQRRSRIGGHQRFDAQLAANRARLERTLAAAGWHEPPSISADALSALFGNTPWPERLIHLPRNFAGQPEAVIRRKMLSGDRVVVFRAWRSGARLVPDGTPVLLVQVRMLEPVTRLGMFNTWREVDQASNRALAKLHAAGAEWQWRQPGPDAPWLVRSEVP